ncbi:hypothetical protein D3C86_1998730 [compost metagenome]
MEKWCCSMVNRLFGSSAMRTNLITALVTSTRILQLSRSRRRELACSRVRSLSSTFSSAMATMAASWVSLARVSIGKAFASVLMNSMPPRWLRAVVMGSWQ